MIVQARTNRLRISNSVDTRRQAKRRNGLDQKALQLIITFAVAPIADPDQVGVLVRAGVGTEQRRIGSFMPGKGAATPSARNVDLPQHFAESEHRVIAFQIEALDFVGSRHRPMMGIVKEQQEMPAANAASANLGNERRI